MNFQKFYLRISRTQTQPARPDNPERYVPLPEHAPDVLPENPSIGDEEIPVWNGASCPITTRYKRLFPLAFLL